MVAGTQGLFRLMVTFVPRACWYLKLDSDTFVNMHELRTSLLADALLRAAATTNAPAATPSAEAFGHIINLFRYRSRPDSACPVCGVTRAIEIRTAWSRGPGARS